MAPNPALQQRLTKGSGYYFVTSTQNVLMNLSLGTIFDVSNNYIVWSPHPGYKEVHYFDVSKKTGQEIFKLKPNQMVRNVKIREFKDEVIVVILVSRIQDYSSGEKVHFGTFITCLYKDGRWQHHTVDALWPLYFKFQLTGDGKKCVSDVGSYRLSDEWAENNMSLLPMMLLLDSEEYVMADLPEKYKKAEIMIASDDGNYIAVQSGRDVLLWHLEKKLTK